MVSSEAKKITPKGKQSRKKIIDAGLASFKQKGYEETTVQDICSSLNIAVGTFYHYFSSKHDLILTLNSDMNAELTEYYQKLDKSSYKEAILKVINFYMGIYLANGVDLLNNVYRGFIFSGDNLFDLDKFALFWILQDAFRNGQEAGEFAREYDAVFLAETLKGIFFLNSTLWCNHRDEELFKENIIQKTKKYLHLVSR